MIEKILTPRELRILRLVSEGCSDREIAKRLSVSVNTVESHIRKIYEKVGPHPDDTPLAVAVARPRPTAMQFTDARGRVPLSEPAGEPGREPD
jgi:DNA-binding NarL/FixJ family response regulator